jgi:hypothetical protein
MATRFWVGGTGTWDAADTTHWAASSNGAGGQSVPGAGDTVTFDGSSGGGTVTVNVNFSVTSVTMGAFTGTLTFATNNNSPTMATFSCSGTGARTLAMGSGTWTLTGTGTVWDTSTATNLTLTKGTATIAITTDTASSRTVTCASVEVNNITVSAGSGSLNLVNVICANLTLTGFVGSWERPTGANISLKGNLVLGSGMTVVGGGLNLITFSGTSGTQTLTSNGVDLNRRLVIDGVGGTLQLVDALLIADSGITSDILLTNGTFNANNQNVTVGQVSSNNSNTRVLTMGSGTWTITGSGNVWNLATITGLTFNKNTANIKFTDTTNTASTFAGGGLTYNNVWFSRGASTATNTITGANTYADFKDDGSEAHTIVFPNATSTFTSFTVNGSAGKLITLARTGGSGTFTLDLTGGGRVDVNYISVTTSAAHPMIQLYPKRQ